MLTKIKNLLKKRSFIFFLLFLFLYIQLVYSFLFPSCGYTGTGHGWLSLQDLITHERSPLGGSDTSIIDKFSPFFSKYSLVADGAVYILLAKNFPQYYFEDNLFLSRPLYSFLVAVVAFLPSLFFNSYAIFFASAIFLNFILVFATAIMFYLLVEKIISSRVAFLSSFLYIFSPIVHAEIIQPEPGIYGTFMIITALYLLYNYVKKPSFLKLIIFSLIIGVFLLGKLFCAISIFILLLAIYYKRLKEGFLFLIVHSIPLVFWYLWVTQVFKLKFFDPSIGNFGSAVWLLDVFSWPPPKIAAIFIDVFPKFILSAIYGFFLVPLIFALLGFKKLILEKKEIIYSSFILAFLILLFVANLYYPYYGFLMFPLVYPLTVLGIDRIADFLKRYKNWYATVFYVAAIGFLVIISSFNIYNLYEYWRI